MAQLLITRRPYSVVKDRVFLRRNVPPLEIAILYDSEAWPPMLRRSSPGIRLVEIAGIEPATSGLQSRRSPN
jgi:hypothetical protein